MRASRIFLIVIIVVAMAVAAGTVDAQPDDRDTASFIKRTTDTLRQAGQSLTKEQIKKMEGLEAGPNFRNEIMNILTDDQKNALRNSYRNNPRRDRDGDRRGGGNFVERIAATLEEAKLPLSDDQKKKLGELEFGQGMREKMAEILTDDQNKALQEARQRGGNGERRSPSEFIGRTLQEAGDPLTEEQKKKIDALEFGQGMREEMNKLLTGSQKKILEAQRGQRDGNR